MSVYNIWVTKHREYENAAIVYEIDNDGDLHAFSVMTNEHGEVREMLVCPQTIEDMQQCIRSLNEGDCPIGWENGGGDVVSWEASEPSDSEWDDALRYIVIDKTEHEEFNKGEFDNFSDALKCASAELSHLTKREQETQAVMIWLVGERYDECGDVLKIVWENGKIEE